MRILSVQETVRISEVSVLERCVRMERFDCMLLWEDPYQGQLPKIDRTTVYQSNR